MITRILSLILSLILSFGLSFCSPCNEWTFAQHITLKFKEYFCLPWKGLQSLSTISHIYLYIFIKLNFQIAFQYTPRRAKQQYRDLLVQPRYERINARCTGRTHSRSPLLPRIPIAYRSTWHALNEAGRTCHEQYAHQCLLFCSLNHLHLERISIIGKHLHAHILQCLQMCDSCYCCSDDQS